MLKAVSSITNAIGALNYKGTWNASTNVNPTLASGVGTKGDYYVVSVAGSTNIDGQTLWGVGDWIVFNGSVWQRVEGGDTGNFTTVNASSTITGSALIPSNASIPTNGMFLPAANTVGFATNSAEAMRINATGTMGLGVSPSAWGANFKAIDAGTRGAFMGASGGAYLTYNCYYDGSNWIYKATTVASVYSNELGAHKFLIAASGTSGSVATFVQAATIDTNGNMLVTGAGGLGYGSGSGGTVTQQTSRTNGVTLDKTNGAITLVSAAGSATWQSFIVTNNKVAATDTIIVNQKSGTDLYMLSVTAVSTGSFRISFATTGGTTTEQPVFNFAVIKAVTA